MIVPTDLNLVDGRCSDEHRDAHKAQCRRRIHVGQVGLAWKLANTLSTSALQLSSTSVFQ